MQAPVRRGPAVRWLPLLLLFALAVPAGCGRESDLPFVSLAPAGDAGSAGGETSTGLRLGVAPILSPEASYSQYEPLAAYLAKRLQRPVELVESTSYADMNAWVRQGRVDFALICSEPYVDGHADFGMQLLAIPVIRGSEVYHSDVIVRADSRYRTLADLRGAVFAFVDPMSFSGDLAVRALLAEQGYDPKSFFRRVIYTSSHDNSVTAVLGGLVDGAAVDSHTLAGFLERHPAERAEIRVVARSVSAGNPPFVAGPALDSRLRRQLQEAFLQMDRDPEGRAALQAMGVERFAPPSERLYDPVRRAEELVRGRS